MDEKFEDEVSQEEGDEDDEFLKDLDLELED